MGRVIEPKLPLERSMESEAVQEKNDRRHRAYRHNAHNGSSISRDARVTDFIRWLWLKSGSVERRLFLLSELADLRRRGHEAPPFTVRKILKNPADAEDYVNFLRFIRPDESIFLIDVGANAGYWLAEFLDWFPNTHAFAIEPAKDTFAVLSKRFKKDSRVTTAQAAVSNRSGSGTLRLVDDSTLNSLETYNSEFSEYRMDATRSVETVRLARLDEIIEAFPPADCRVLKIDVQGHEIEAIEGSHSVLDKIDVALCELSFVGEFVGKPPSFSKVTALMEAAGLYPVIFQEYGKQISNHLLECDVVYVRPERFEALYLARNK